MYEHIYMCVILASSLILPTRHTVYFRSTTAYIIPHSFYSPDKKKGLAPLDAFYGTSTPSLLFKAKILFFCVIKIISIWIFKVSFLSFFLINRLHTYGINCFYLILIIYKEWYGFKKPFLIYQKKNICLHTVIWYQVFI